MENGNTNPNMILVKVDKMILRKEYDRAKKILSDFINTYTSKYKEDDTTRYFCFRNIFEFYCATSKLKINKEMKWINCDLSTAYEMLCYIYTQEGKINEGREFADKAIYYNPINPCAYFDKSESYKFEKDFKNMMNVTKEAYDYIYTSRELARYYRNLGFCYTEEGKYEESYAMYILSLTFDEGNEIAIDEIEYIKEQTNNSNFTISLDRLKEILLNENIPYGIKDENKTTLLSFITREEFARYPKIIEFVKNDIKKFTIEMREPKDVENDNEDAKITCEDLLDESKIVKDELDIIRGKKNIEYLRSIGVDANDNLKVVPINLQTKLASKEEVVRLMMVDYVVAYLSAEAIQEGNDVDLDADLNALDSRFRVRELFNSDDEAYINNILNNKLSRKELSNTTWLYEGCSILMWCLGLKEKPSLYKQCTADSLFQILADMNSYEDLLERTNLRSKEEIMEFDDLVTRASSAYREAKQKNESIENLDYNILMEYHIALNSILNWSINNLIKEYIDVNFKKGDFNFIFNMPTMLTFDAVTPKRNKKCLFSLVSANRLTVITLLDMGKISKDDFNNRYNDDVDSYRKDNWNIVREREFKIDNIECNVKELVITKIIPPVEIPVIGLTRYYFILNNHLVCLEVLLERNVNYQDDTFINNSMNSDIALRILNSFRAVNNKVS